MPRRKKYESAAERQKAYRERRAQDVDPSLPERQVDEEPRRPATRPLKLLLKMDPYKPLSELEEQMLRDHYGYTDSEKRTRAQREDVARGIISKAGPPSQNYLNAIKKLEDEHRRHLEKVRSYLESLNTPA
jgi:hypothetical protein